MYTVIDSTNSINNTTDNLMSAALMLGAGQNLLVKAGGSILATGDGSDAVYLNGNGANDNIVVDGLIMGERQAIYSLGQYASITVNGQVIGGSTGVSIANDGKLYVGQAGLVSGGVEGVALNGATLVNDGTVSSTGNDAIQFSGGTIVNNGLISSQGWAITFTDDSTGRITNTGTIQGDLGAGGPGGNADVYLTIENSGNWYGSILLTAGDDTLNNTGTIDGNVSLGAGNDIIDSRYGLITGTISAGAGIDTIRAGAEDDIIDGGAGADIINGGGGHNAVNYQSSSVGVRVDLASGIAKFGDAAGDKLTHIQDITGTLENDTLTGDGNDNALSGIIGKDILTGNGGNDSFLLYGGGNAIISGGTGNDYIQMQTVDSANYGFAFSAVNKINGGAGVDTLDLTNSGSVVFKAATLTNVERIIVEDGFNYSLTSAEATVAKNKVLEVDAGSLTGTHKLVFNGSAEHNGRFILNGGAGDDVFKGGAGADTIVGSGGKDVLTGGGGADTFVFNTPADSLFAAHDRITSFVAGTDKLMFDVDVTGIDKTVAGSVTAASDLESLLNGHMTADHAVLVKVNAGSLSGHTLLVVDADGVAGYNAMIDYMIDIKVTGHLATSDFLF